LTHEHLKNGVPPLAGEGRHKNSDHPQYTTIHEHPIDRVLDAIRAQGGSVKQSGGQWMCTCPAHDDRNPSLSVKQGDDGRVLLHCHRGCSVESVVDVLGLDLRDLFVPDTCDSDSFRPQRPASPQSVAVAHGTRVTSRNAGYSNEREAVEVCARSMGGFDHRWEYHDASGDLVGIVLRRNLPGGKKTYRPISRIDGRWHLEGMPVPRPLYALPALLFDDSPVIVCEGEKATDAAIACGYTATTSPHGCNSAKQADWSVLRNRDVIIIPDLDEAGDAYAREVLFFSESAKSVRVVDLTQTWPQLEDGDDLADVLTIESGDTTAVRTKLDALIKQTPTEVQNNTTTGQFMRPFPVHLLPEPVRSYVIEGAASIGCDPSYIVLPVLSMLAGAIGNTHSVLLKDGWEEPCVVWSCIVGRSGTAKSPAIDLAFKPLKRIQESLYLRHQSSEVPAEVTDDRSTQRPPRCIIGDVTIEATMQLIQENPHGIVLLRDELASWFDFDRYGKGKGVGSAALWIELFHARSVSVDRRTQESIFAQRASLSIAGGIQPGTLGWVFDRKNLESGLVARFLFAMPIARPKRWSDASISRDTQQAMQTLVEGLYAHELCTVPPYASEHQPKPHVIPLSPEARKAFARFADKHCESILSETEEIAAAWTKLECYVPRLALIMHLVREQQGDPTLIDPESIDADSIQAAIELVMWFKQETKRLYAAILLEEHDREQLELVEWIRSRGGHVSQRDLSRGPAKYRSSRKAQAALSQLVERGIGIMRAKTGGRTMEFVLHQSHADTCDSDTFATESPKNPQTVAGASGRYPVLSNRKGQ
jgi:hypothetical protein